MDGAEGGGRRRAVPDQLIEEEPGDPRAMLGKGLGLLTQGHPADAAACIDGAAAGDYCGYSVDRLTHSLQTATRAQRDGRIVRYVADMTGFRDLLAYLMEDCCNGSPELCELPKAG